MDEKTPVKTNLEHFKLVEPLSSALTSVIKQDQAAKNSEAMVSCEKSEAVQLYWKWKDNETILGPSVLQTWDCPPSEWLPLLIIGKKLS